MQHMFFTRKPPYILDTSTSKEIYGVTLYQLVATKRFEVGITPKIVLSGHNTLPLGVSYVVAKHARGGWVPSLDVLEYSSKGFPWLDERSEVRNPHARLRGSVYLIDSIWDSPLWLEGPVQKTHMYRIESCSVTGNTSISLRTPTTWPQVPRRYKDPRPAWTYANACIDSTFHNTHLEGKINTNRVHMKESAVRATSVTQIHYSHLHACTLLHRALQPLTVENSHWKHTTLSIGMVPHSKNSDNDALLIKDSSLAHVVSSHPAVSNTTLRGASGHVLSVPPAPPHDPASLRAAPLYIEGQQAPACVVWYNLSSTQPWGVYDIHQARLVPLDSLNAYVQALEPQPCAHALRWWQWQHAVGVELPKDQPWICPAIAMAPTPASWEPIDLSP